MFLGQDPLDLAFWAVVIVIALLVFVGEHKRHRGRRYAPADTLQKATCYVLLAAMVVAWAIYLADWRVFGGYEKQVALAVQLIGLLYIVRLMMILELPKAD